MSKLKDFIENKLPTDKKHHLILGDLINEPLAFIGFVIDMVFGLPLIAFNTLLILAILFHAWKELIHDWRDGKGNPEFWDFFCGSRNAFLILLIGDILYFELWFF